MGHFGVNLGQLNLGDFGHCSLNSSYTGADPKVENLSLTLFEIWLALLPTFIVGK